MADSRLPQSPVSGDDLTQADLRVLHLGRFYNENFGGLERTVMLLLRELNRKPGVRVDNLVAADTLRSSVIHVDGYQVFRAASFGVLASTALSPALVWQARRLVRQNRYQLVHLHFPDPLSALCVRFLPRDVRLVISWHSDVIRQKRLIRLLRPLVDPVIARADALVAATPAHFTSSTQLSACADPAKKIVIPYGYPLEDLAGTPAVLGAASKLRARFQKGNPRQRIVFAVGRHIYYKGFEYLIRAMAGLPDTVLLLGGRGPLTDELQRLAGELGIGNRVIFVGRIPDNELVHYYHACDVFCMPSVEPAEAFGLVQMEAMACGKAVVCCELNNGVTYVNRHGETGLVVPPRDPAALCQALGQLLNRPELCRQLGAQAYRRVWSEFTLTRMGEQMLGLYRRLLAPDGRSGLISGEISEIAD